MPKNSILIEQGGCGEINSQTPVNIQSLSTIDLETCVALLLIKDGAIKLFHIDKYTAIDSIKKEVENFGYKDYKLFRNNEFLARHKGAPDITNDIICGLDLVFGRKIGSDKIFDTDRNFLVEIDRNTGLIKIFTKKSDAEISSLIINNRPLEQYRREIRYIERMFYGDQPIAVDFDGKHIKKIKELSLDLKQDIDSMFNFSTEKKLLWFSRDRKYQNLEIYREKGSLQFLVNQVNGYIMSAKKCGLILTRYKIPFIDNDKIRLLQEISQEFGENANLKTRRESDWSLSYEVSLPCDFLKQDIRKELGLDRKSIVNLGHRQSDFLNDSIDGVTIEPHKEKPGRILVTFPAGEDFVRIIESVSSVENLKKTLAQEPSSTVEDVSVTSSAASRDSSH